MTNEEMIDIIYEKIANKELRFWCKIMCRYWSTIDGWLNSEYQSDMDEEFIYLSHNEVFNEELNEAIRFSLLWEKKDYAKIIHIIWHSVMIWDILDYIWKLKDSFEKIDMHKRWILLNWKRLRKPIW